MKVYPACASQQTTIELGLELHRAFGLREEDIVSVCETVSPSIKGAPWYDFAGPFGNQFQAQMSSRFCLAAALLGRPMRSPALTASDFADPEIHALAKRVTLVAEEGRGHYQPRIEVVVRSGARHVVDEDRLPHFVPTPELVREKFTALAGPVLGAGPAAAIVDAVQRLDQLASVRELARLL